MSRSSPISRIRNGSIEEVLDTIQTARQKEHVYALLRRCEREIMEGEPSRALEIGLKGPDYVLEVMSGPIQPDYLAWAHSVLGTCLSLRKLPRLADCHFELAKSVEDVSPMEIAAVTTRHSLHQIHHNWRRAYELIENALEISSSNPDDESAVRDDRSRSRYLAARGIILAYGADQGYAPASEPADQDFSDARDQATRDFIDALSGTNAKRDIHTRQTAVSGICQLSSRAWLSGSTPVLSPRQALQIVSQTKKESRERRVPQRSLVNCYCRWTEGIALFFNAGETLTRQAARVLRSARDDLARLGRIPAAVELTIDLQWCMLRSEHYVDALEEYQFIDARIDELPEAWLWPLNQWHTTLKTRTLQATAINFVFKTIRGIPVKVDPAPSSLPYRGDSGGW